MSVYAAISRPYAQTTSVLFSFFPCLDCNSQELIPGLGGPDECQLQKPAARPCRLLLVLQEKTKAFIYMADWWGYCEDLSISDALLVSL